MNKKRYDQKWELMICKVMPNGALKVLDTKTLPVRLNDERSDVLAKYKNKEYSIRGEIYSRNIVVA